MDLPSRFATGTESGKAGFKLPPVRTDRWNDRLVFALSLAHRRSNVPIERQNVLHVLNTYITGMISTIRLELEVLKVPVSFEV